MPCINFPNGPSLPVGGSDRMIDHFSAIVRSPCIILTALIVMLLVHMLLQFFILTLKMGHVFSSCRGLFVFQSPQTFETGPSLPVLLLLLF